MFNMNFNNKNKRSAQPPEQNHASLNTELHGEKTNENNDGISLLDKHENGYIDDKSFLSSFGKVDVFYSTPFGDHKDGKSRLFVLPARHDPLKPKQWQSDVKSRFYI